MRPYSATAAAVLTLFRLANGLSVGQPYSFPLADPSQACPSNTSFFTPLPLSGETPFLFYAGLTDPSIGSTINMTFTPLPENSGAELPPLVQNVTLPKYAPQGACLNVSFDEIVSAGSLSDNTTGAIKLYYSYEDGGAQTRAACLYVRLLDDYTPGGDSIQRSCALASETASDTAPNSAGKRLATLSGALLALLVSGVALVA